MDPLDAVNLDLAEHLTPTPADPGPLVEVQLYCRDAAGRWGWIWVFGIIQLSYDRTDGRRHMVLIPESPGYPFEDRELYECSGPSLRPRGVSPQRCISTLSGLYWPPASAAEAYRDTPHPPHRGEAA